MWGPLGWASYVGNVARSGPPGWPVLRPGSGLALIPSSGLRRVLGQMLGLYGREITAALERVPLRGLAAKIAVNGSA